MKKGKKNNKLNAQGLPTEVAAKVAIIITNARDVINKVLEQFSMVVDIEITFYKLNKTKDTEVENG